MKDKKLRKILLEDNIIDGGTDWLGDRVPIKRGTVRRKIRGNESDIHRIANELGSLLSYLKLEVVKNDFYETREIKDSSKK